MLKNILKKVVKDKKVISDGIRIIKYNQIPITVKPDEVLDVRDFGVGSDQIVAVEKHILLKNPNVFEQSKTEDIFKTAKEALQRIKDLETENAKLQEDLNKVEEGSIGYAKEAAKVKTENEGLTDQVKSLKQEVAEFRAKLKAKA